MKKTGKNTAAASQDLRDMQDAAGSTARALAQQSKSVSYQWNKLKASAEVLAIAERPLCASPSTSPRRAARATVVSEGEPPTTIIEARVD